MPLTEKVKKRLTGKSGSSTVFLAMAFVTFAICIAGSIGVSRHLTVMSECRSFGRVWSRAILSEYDRHLLEDYGLMAYWGNEAEVVKRIDAYFGYSASGRLGIHIGGTVSDLTGYELGEPDNFRDAMKKGFAGSSVKALLSNTSREERDRVKGSAEGGEGSDGNDHDGGAGSSGSGRAIGNAVVLDTLPSGGMGGSVSTDALTERAKSLRDEEGVRSAAASAGTEVAFMWRYFSSNATVPDDKPHYLDGELEYVIKGSPEDKVNYEACRKRIFLMRNALNLVSLYMDAEKTELITAAAELITPGPLGAATQLLIAEAWAALETEEDLKVLYDNGRVPVIKTPEQWQTDLGSVLDSSKVRGSLDDEAKELLDENREEIDNLPGAGHAASLITEGLSYDDHLMLMILCMNTNTRLLRVMDIVQIDMKYRYYRDFNLMEYYTGVRYALTADGRDYVFEDSYK